MCSWGRRAESSGSIGLAISRTPLTVTAARWTPDKIAPHSLNPLHDSPSAAGAVTQAEVAAGAPERGHCRGQTGHHKRAPSRGISDLPVDLARGAAGEVEADAETGPEGGVDGTDRGHENGPTPCGNSAALPQPVAANFVA